VTDLTYPEHGATRGELPPGYRHVERWERIGAGEATFHDAAAAVLGWRVHRGAGLTVVAGPEPAVDAVAVMRLGPPLLGPLAPCRVVYVVDEPRRRGFAYGTIAGHPFQGEEAFVVEWAEDDGVFFSIRAFSRPATALVRLAAPVISRIQDIVTDRFVRALRSAVITRRPS
jgi:uncharacterized protein (UPF0548 family)